MIITHAGEIAVNCTRRVTLFQKNIGVFLDIQSTIFLAPTIEAFTAKLYIFFIILDVSLSGFIIVIF